MKQGFKSNFSKNGSHKRNGPNAIVAKDYIVKGRYRESQKKTNA